MDWQPIETAPKDGTPILCYAPQRQAHWVSVYVVKWSDPDEDDGTGWVEAAGEEWGRWNATHWMPLPAPPQD